MTFSYFSKLNPAQVKVSAKVPQDLCGNRISIMRPHLSNLIFILSMMQQNCQAPGQPVGFAADRITELFTGKDWTPLFGIHGCCQHYHLLQFSSWSLWIFLLNSSGDLFGFIFLVFPFFFHHQTEKHDYSPAGRKLCKIMSQSHRVLQAQKGGTVLPRTPNAACSTDVRSFPPPGLPPL